MRGIANDAVESDRKAVHAGMRTDRAQAFDARRETLTRVHPSRRARLWILAPGALERRAAVRVIRPRAATGLERQSNADRRGGAISNRHVNPRQPRPFSRPSAGGPTL
jgi:hypothetical protein